MMLRILLTYFANASAQKTDIAEKVLSFGVIYTWFNDWNGKD